MAKKMALTLALLLLSRSGAALADPQIDRTIDLAEEAFNQGDVVLAMAHYREAAEAGDTSAQVRLAGLLDYAEEDAEAVAWYQRAAEQNDAGGAYGLAKMHATGEGVERSTKDALRWFTKAGDLGHAGAIRTLATAYEKGNLDVAVDHAQAVAWLERGAEAADTWSIVRLARAYRDGDLGLAVDETRARSLEDTLEGNKP